MADPPGPALPGESAAYRIARARLLEAEADLRRRIEAVAAERRSLPLGGEPPLDYPFAEEGPDGEARTVPLSGLFDPGKDTLLLYSFMYLPEGGDPLGVPCPSCTSIVDSLDGAAPHLEQRLSLAVAAKAPIGRLAEHGRARGWRNIRLLSSAGTPYNHDYLAESPDGGRQLPVATVFVRREGRIHHFWTSELAFAPTEPGLHPRHVDFMWPLWNILDLTPEGRGTDWFPALAYT